MPTGADTGPAAPINLPSDDPMIIACRAGDLDKVRYLVKHDVALNVADKNGLFPLEIAVYKGNLPLVEYLLENGADVNFQSCQGEAILVSKTEKIALFLLQHGADLDQRLGGDTGDRVAERLFSLAAAKGWNTLLADIFPNVGDPNIRDGYGRTPLFGAAEAGNVTTTKMLLNWGAEVDATDEDGLTALMEACCRGQLSTATELIAHGANVSHQEKSGMTVLTLAVFRCWNPAGPYGSTINKVPILRLLVESGATIEAETLEKLRMSHCQAEYQYLKSVFEGRSTQK